MENPDAQLKRGLVWLGSATLFTRLVDLVALLVVLFTLSASDLGEASIAFSLVLIVEAVVGSGLGLGTSLLQAERLSDGQKDGAFWLSVGVGVLGSAVLCLVSPWVAAYFHAPRVRAFLCVLAVRLLALSSRVVPLSLLNRDLHFKEVSSVQAGATVGAAIVRVGLSLVAGGAWGLIVAHLVNGVLAAVLSFAFSSYRPRRRIRVASLAEVGPLVRFGVRAAGADAASQLYRDVDYFFVARLLGLEALGLYRVAFDVAMEPTVPLSDLVRRTCLPVLSRLAAEPRRQSEAFLYTTRTLALLVGPVVVTLYLVSDDLLALLADGRFVGAATTTRLLLLAAGLRMLFQLFGSLFVAAGRPGLALRFELLALGVLGVALASALSTLGGELGIAAAGLAWLIAFPFLLLAVVVVAKRLVGLRATRFAQALVPGTIGSILAFVAGRGIRALVVDARLGSVVRPAGSAVLDVGLVLLAVFVSYAAYLKLALGLSVRSVFAVESDAREPVEVPSPRS